MKKTKLIVDSGSTKSTWRICWGKHPEFEMEIQGFNPYLQSYEEIQKDLKTALLPHNWSDIDVVYFYGAGCVFDKADIMHKALSEAIPSAEVHVYSDLLGAAHSTCGTQAGIACIMGTGSNSCFYDGVKIEKNVPSLGYVLGDEGGGVALGRRLVSDVLRGILPKALQDAFRERFNLTQADILDRVYKQPYPNRFLAGLSPFLFEHKADPSVRQLVGDCFLSFFERTVMLYDYQRYETHFIGSIAFYYSDILTEIATIQGIRVGKIVKSPMNGLMAYYRLI